MSHKYTNLISTFSCFIKLLTVFWAGCICNNAQTGGLSAFQESSTIQWAAWKYLHCELQIFCLNHGFYLSLLQILQFIKEQV